MIGRATETQPARYRDQHFKADPIGQLCDLDTMVPRNLEVGRHLRLEHRTVRVDRK